MVTAVIVAHDGAAWLPRLMDALDGQTTPVQRVVAVDTGSRDRSGSLLAAHLGQGSVFGMDRSTGYAAAVRRAVAHKAATAPVAVGAGGPSGRDRGEQVEWLWLLHDDCEPAADALEQLLRGAADTPTAAVFGPKIMDWSDRDVIVEAGLTLDTAGRRVTDVEPREVDQGQHDGDRDTLAVGSAGMLVRRDVFEQAGGFDPGMALFGEDIDFCWRVHEAGFRVRVITGAVLFHAAAASRGRRAISVGRRARLLERRNALITLLGNLPAGPMAAALIGNVTLSLLRTVFYLIAKRPTAALDEAAAVLGVVGHPLRLAKSRRLRARGRRAAYAALRGDVPPGHSLRRAAEFAASVVFRPAPEDLAGAHHATDDPDDDESLLTDSGVLQRMLTRPGVLLTIALIVITIAAERSLVTAGTLGGGALLPAWEGSSSLWPQFLQAYHPAGIGSASAGPPYVGMLALLATVLLGKSWLAIDVLLLGCVPLAGISAFLALRRVAQSVAVRVWAAAAYALLPVAFGAISAGRLGSAVAFALIPVIGMLAGRMFSQPRKLARRAAWATGLTVTVGTAFVPLLWPIAVAGAVLALLAFRASGRALLANLAIVVLTPPVLLLPWLIQYLEHPSLLLLEAGLARPGLAAARLPARSLLLLSPGGPGLPPFWVSAALVLAGLAALLAPGRRKLIAAGWSVALLGFAAALLASRTAVTPPGGQQVIAWPGIALAVAAAGLLLAAAAGADGLGRALSSGGRTGLRRVASARGFPAAILALAACTAPVLGAAYWLMNGTSGPIGAATGQIVPSLVSTAGSGRQLRTLVLTMGAGGKVSYLLLRGASPQFSYPDVTPVPAAQAALTKAVASLVAPDGGEAADQSQELARFDIGFVLVRAPIPGGLAGVLNSVSGLTEVSLTSSFDLWRLTTLPSRVSVIEPSGAVVQVGSGAIGVSGAPAPAAGGIVLLAEPAGGWSASVSGHALTPVASPAGSWAQAFRLPAGGGTLTISRNGFWHDLVMALELLAFLIVAALALPGIRSTAEMEAAAAAAVAAGAAGPDGDARDDEAAVAPGRPDRAGPGGDDDETAGSPGRAPAVAGAAAATGRSGRLRRQPAGPARRLGRGSASRSRRTGQADDGEAPAATPGRGRSGRRGGDISVPAQPGAPRSGRRAAAGTPPAGGAAGADSAGTAGGPGGVGAGVAGAAAAGGTLAGASRAAGASAGRGRRGREANPAEAARPGPRGAAWPAGQPVSRFVSGPPEMQPPPRGVAPAEPRVAERDAGMGAPPGDGQPAPGRELYADGPRTSATRTPPGSGYLDAPGYAGYPGQDDEYPAGRPADPRRQRDLPGYADRGGPGGGYPGAREKPAAGVRTPGTRLPATGTRAIRMPATATRATGMPATPTRAARTPVIRIAATRTTDTGPADTRTVPIRTAAIRTAAIRAAAIRAVATRAVAIRTAAIRAEATRTAASSLRTRLTRMVVRTTLRRPGGQMNLRLAGRRAVSSKAGRRIISSPADGRRMTSSTGGRRTTRREQPRLTPAGGHPARTPGPHRRSR